MAQTFIVDSHVHLHPNFKVEQALTQSFENFSAYQSNALGIMFLVERAGEKIFDYLRDFAAVGMPLGPIQISLTEEKEALLLTKGGSAQILLIAGRQIATQERLEVLSIGSGVEPTRDLSLIQAVEFAHTHNAFPIIPWSPGKWIGERRKYLEQAIKRWPPSELAFGDIGMRPRFIPEFDFLKDARKAGYLIVCGSDPLPLDGEEVEIFKYASSLHLESEVGIDAVWQTLKQALGNSEARWERVGQRNGVFRAVKRSVALRVR